MFFPYINIVYQYDVDGKRISNINQKFHESLNSTYGRDLPPPVVLYYIYAILYSNIYRTKYAEFLKMDFPKIPVTQNYEVFRKMSKLGEQLAYLHLMKSVELNTLIAKFQGDGDYIVQKIKYKDGKVFINKNQYFEGVEQEVYDYYIGGYKVCDKWLKSRKGRKLFLDDITHYCEVVTTIKETMKTQKKIDEVYKEIETKIIDMNK